MAIVRGCPFPEEFFYDVGNHVWYQPETEGIVRLGITPVGVALAREILVFTPKRVGHRFQAGKALALVESGKWIGSVRAAFAGEVTVINEPLTARADLLNVDCYGAGWMMLVRPEADDWRAATAPGATIAAAYEAWMEENGFAGCGK